MPGMNVYMNAAAVNVDGDPFLEVYLTPKSLGGPGRVQLIKYDSLGGGFFQLADISAPPFPSGPAAVGDFDDDGFVEFISGSELTYSLFEYRNSQLSYIGDVGGPYHAETHHATAARPYPGGKLHAVLGYSSIELGFRYQVLEAVADNQFQLVDEIIEEEPTGWSGFPRSGAADLNCDGRDDLLLRRYPGPDEIYSWDSLSQLFVPICGIDHPTYGTLIRFFDLDINRNGVAELAGVNTDEEFYAFEGECTTCTPIAADIAAWWAFDELSGGAAHDTWGSNHGNAVGSPTPVTGIVEGAWSLDGATEWVTVPDNLSLDVGTGDFTVDAWINTTSPAPQAPIISKYDPGTGRGLAFWIQDGQRLGARLADGTNSDFLSSGVAPIADGGWHHVALRVDRDDPAGLEFWVDGDLLGSDDPTVRSGDLGIGTPILLGRWNPAPSESTIFAGALDEVRLFRRALSDIEIRSVGAVGPYGNCKPVSYVCLCPSQGDLDTSGLIDAVDLAEEIDIVFFGTPDPASPVCPTTMGDFNGNFVTDAVDLAFLIDHVFFGGNAPADPCDQ